MILMPHQLAPVHTAPVPLVEWEEPDCVLCGGSRWTNLVEAPDCAPHGTGLWFAVVQCADCGLCFTNPRPSESSIGQFYPSAYRPHRTPKPERSPLWQILKGGKSARRGKERQTLPWQGQGRLLDFGCGGGSYLERMHRQGWEVLGVDSSPAAVERVQSVLGLPALLGSLPHEHLRPQSFDVITMWHSLEHVHWPTEVLRAAYNLLVPGGTLVVAVPNIDSLAFRWFGSSWFGLDLPRHLTHFSPWTLHLILERAGFHVGPIRMIRHADWMRSSAQLSCAQGRGSRWHRLLTLKSVSRLVTYYSSVVADCDALIVTATRPG